MARAKEANKDLRISLIADSSQFARGMQGATRQLTTFEQRVRGFSRSFDKVGQAIQRNLVLPMVAVGAASIKLSVDFEASMQKIVALVGLPQAQVESFKEGVKDLAVETGRSAKELADAMFFITSAGIRGGASGDPMAVLAMSAKAAAAGMGETKVVADALTSAVNAYGAESLSAADATDVLVATIREGKLEADQVSQVIGKVIPIAAELGVEFHEVGAAIATMSRIGIDADVGSTALRAMLNGLLKPTADTEKAFREVGTSGEALRKMLADEGLLATLLFLQRAFEGNSSAMGRAFPNVRALTGVLGILADNAKQANFIFGSLADNTGDTDRAFQAMTETTQFGLAQAWTALKVAGIELGDTLAPMVKDLAAGVRGLAEGFSSLGETTQGIIMGFGKAALAGLALTVVFSKLVGLGTKLLIAWPKVVSAFETLWLLAGSTAAFAGAVSLVAAAVGALGAAIFLGIKDSVQYAQDLDKLSAAMEGVNDSAVRLTQQDIFTRGFAPQLAFENFDSSKNARDDLRRLGMGMGDVQRIIDGGLPALTAWRDTMKDTLNLWDADTSAAFRHVSDNLGRVIRLAIEAEEKILAARAAEIGERGFGAGNIRGQELRNELADDYLKPRRVAQRARTPFEVTYIGSREFELKSRRAFDELNRRQLVELAKNVEITREWQEATAAIVDNTIGLFADAPDQIKVDFDKWEAELVGQEDAVRRWSDGVLALMDAGLTNLALEIYEAGPEAADAVTELLADMEEAVNFESILIEMQTFAALVELAVADALDGVTSLFEAAFKGFTDLKRLMEFGFVPEQLFNPIEDSGIPSGESERGLLDPDRFSSLTPQRSFDESYPTGRPTGQTVYVDTVNLYAEVENDPSTARRILEELADGIQRLDREGVN